MKSAGSFASSTRRASSPRAPWLPLRLVARQPGIPQSNSDDWRPATTGLACRNTLDPSMTPQTGTWIASSHSEFVQFHSWRQPVNKVTGGVLREGDAARSRSSRRRPADAHLANATQREGALDIAWCPLLSAPSRGHRQHARVGHHPAPGRGTGWWVAGGEREELPIADLLGRCLLCRR